MSFLDLDSVKSQLRISISDTSNDVAIQAMIDAVTIVVENHLSVTIDPESFTDEMYVKERTNRLRVLNTPLTTLTSITDARTGDIDITGAITRQSGLIVLASWISADSYLDVTYSSGIADNAIPQNWIQAGLIICQQMWETRRGGMPSTAATLDESISKESYRQGFLVGYVIPNRALELLGPKPPLVA